MFEYMLELEMLEFYFTYYPTKIVINIKLFNVSFKNYY